MKRSFLAGVPLNIRHEFRVDGEVAPRDVERLLNVVRETTGRMGVAAASTRELAWHAGGRGARLSATVVPRDDVTTVVVERNLRRMLLVTLVLAMGSVGLFGGMGIGVMVDEMLDHAEEISVPVGFASGLYLTLLTTRFAMRRLRARIDRSAKNLAERLASKVRESIG
jgi:hypothetical protein